MTNINKEYQALQNVLQEVGAGNLHFESGWTCGTVNRITMADGIVKVHGRYGSDDTERCLMEITSAMQSGRDYEYLEDFHCLEYYG